MNKNIATDKKATIEIIGLSHDGRGVAKAGQKTMFVSGALPHEIVTYEINQKHAHYHEATALEIIHHSPSRVAPPCSHFGVCGGCNLQHMDTNIQLQFKQDTLLDQLKHFGQVVPQVVLPPLSATTLGYRRKARLGAKFVIKKNKLLVGFREKSSNYLAELEQCEVLYPDVGQRLLALSDLILTLGSYKHIPQIEVAIGDETVALIFRHMKPLSERDKEKLIAFGAAHQFHLYLQPNPPAPVYRLWPNEGPERLTYSLPEYGLEFSFHPLDFTQVNLEMNRLMVNQAIQLLSLNSKDEVLDLFCGIGNFTLPIAQIAKAVTGIEGSSEMVKRAEDNAKHNGIKNVRFFAANLMEPKVDAWAKTAYTKILLDPPRVGAKEILPKLATIHAEKIVYVSCNPATLARDAGELVHQYGYKLTQTGIMNMFPHTAHIEAMAVFEK